MSKQLFNSTAIVGSMTLISRVLGFIRDMVFARFFGVDGSTDAFFVAFKIPNFMRRLFAEGAFSQAFVPVLSEYKAQHSQDDLKGFIDRTGGSLALVLMAVTIIGVIGAPIVIILFAPGFYLEGSRYQLTVDMLRITFPYLFFISSTAFAAGILNTFGRFAVPAFTPVFLNICLIAAAVWLAPLMPEPVLALAWGVFVAGIVQLLFQFPALMRLDLLPRLKFGFNDLGVKRILRLMAPALIGVSVTQINLLFDTLIASFLAAGSVSWLYYSDRLVEFPLGVFGIALATVILPSLSKSHAGERRAEFSASLDWAFRWVLLVGIPASLGLMLLAVPILSTLFQYDAFTADDVAMAAKSLVAYSIGLLGFILVKILVPGFTSRQDMKTPVRFGIYAMIANMLLNIAFVFSLAHAGLALATSLAAFVNAGLLLQRLLRDGVYRPVPGWRKFLARIIVANGAMAALILLLVTPEQWLQWQYDQRALRLAVAILIGGATYAATLLILGLRVKHLLVAPAKR